MRDYNEPQFWVDDIYDMTPEELQYEADHYKRLARHGPASKNKAYRFAYYRYTAAKELLDKLKG
jgi:uncharacterized LabA/DUF88 family protein